MSNALKIFYVVTTGVLISASAQMNAFNNDGSPLCPPKSKCKQDKPSCCEPQRCDVPSPCCPPTCRASPYSGTNCLPAPYCQEVNLRGELLYWTANLGGLEAAFGTTSINKTIAKGITTTTVREVDTAPDWEWKPGFRIGADYAFSCFVLEADWTHYDGFAHFHDDGQHGHWKIHYNTLDLLFGRRFSIAPCFYFKPFVGVRGARIRQSLSSHLETDFDNSTLFTHTKGNERFWGIGPELGLEADWYMGCNFSLYASFDVVTYYGQVRTKVHNTDTFAAAISDNHGRIRHAFNSIATDGSVGIRWDKAWPVASEVLLTFKIGLEQHRIYDFSNLGSDGTLSMDGANFAASIGYRW